jgi:subtilase-type serine protease
MSIGSDATRSTTMMAPSRGARLRRFILATSCIAALSACGGGGGGNGNNFANVIGGLIPGYNYAPSSASPTPEAPSVLTTSFNGLTSFSPAVVMAANALLATLPYSLQKQGWTISGSSTVYRSDPLANSGVVYAHALGLRGAGQTISVVDTGLNTGHNVFAGTTITDIDNPTPTNASSDHGTLVAAIIAGDNASFVGVAPDANLLFGNFANDATTTAATDAARIAGAVAQNNSWGFDGLDIGVSSFNAVFGNASGQTYLNALRNYANQGVVVFAVSNDTTKSHSTLMDGLPYIDPSLEAGWIAVANATPVMNGAGNVSSVTMQSSSCLEAARWCILADGAWSGPKATNNTTVDNFGVGSSFAAPQVSGALALLAEAFPALTPHQLRVRLLASADNKFFTPDGTVELATGFNKGYSFNYGVGFLDVGAALLPIGASQMSLPGGAVQVIDQPVIQSGSAFGNAMAHSLAGVDIAFSDALNGGFSKPAVDLTASAAPQPLASQLMIRSLSADLGLERTSLQASIRDPFAGFSGQSYAVRDPSNIMRADVLMPGSEGGSYGVNLTRAITDGPTRVEVGVKLAHDDGSVMGFGGTDGDAGANMVSLQLGLSQEVGKSGFFTLGGEFGLADLGSQAILSDVSTAGFNSLKLGIGNRSVFTNGDKLALGVSMPMAVTSGSAQMILPVAGRSGRSVFTPIDLDLSPTDRQMDISVSYQRPLAPGLELAVELVHAQNYGNRAGFQDTAGVFALKYSF